MVSRSYVVGLPVIVTVEDGPPWSGPVVRWEVDTSEAAREVERSDDSGYTEEEEQADAATIREWIERHPTVASVVDAIGGNPWDAKLRADDVGPHGGTMTTTHEEEDRGAITRLPYRDTE